MAVQKQDDQHEHTFSNYVRTCLGRWTIGRSGERGSGISVLPAWHDDEDNDNIIIIIIYNNINNNNNNECEKKHKYLDLARELKKQWNMKVTIMPIEIDAFGTVTKGLLKGLEELEVDWMSADHQNNNIIENGQNTEKSPGDLRRLDVTQTPAKDHQMSLMWKTPMEIITNIRQNHKLHYKSQEN